LLLLRVVLTAAVSKQCREEGLLLLSTSVFETLRCVPVLLELQLARAFGCAAASASHVCVADVAVLRA
jgi:hypothetical protein